MRNIQKNSSVFKTRMITLQDYQLLRISVGHFILLWARLEQLIVIRGWTCRTQVWHLRSGSPYHCVGASVRSSENVLQIMYISISYVFTPNEPKTPIESFCSLIWDLGSFRGGRYQKWFLFLNLIEVVVWSMTFVQELWKQLMWREACFMLTHLASHEEQTFVFGVMGIPKGLLKWSNICKTICMINIANLLWSW